MTPVQRVLATARSENGYLEKATNAQLEDKTANAGYNNWNKFAAFLDDLEVVYNGKKNGYAWCDCFVDYCFIYTFGLELGMAMTFQPKKGAGAGCTYSMGYYKKAGRFFKDPQPGDQIFFTNDGGASSYHTGLVEKVEGGRVYTIEGGYLIHEDIHYVEYCLERIKEVCAELGITLNLRKTKIRPITRGIVFLKTKFILTETGRVLRKMSRASMRAMKRKLFKFRKWYEAGEFSLEDIRTAYDSFKGHMRRGDSFKAVARIDLFFKHLFGFHPNDKTKWRATNVPNRKRWDYSGTDRATKLCRAA